MKMKSLASGRFPRESGLVALVAFLSLAGCASKEQIYEDIYQNRRLAYESWKRAREGKEAAQVVVLKGDIDLASAVLIALGNNKQLQAVLTDKEAAAGRLTEAYSAALPKLDVQGTYRRLDKVNSFNTGLTTVTMGAKNNYSVDLVLTQPIFRGGAIVAGIRAARIFSYLTDEKVATGVQDVVFQTRGRYYDVLLARELVKVSEGDLDIAKKHLDDVEKKKAAGVVSQYDVLRASVEVSNVEAQLIERQNALHLGVTSLLKTLGVSQESKVELTDKLEYAKIIPSLDDAVRQAYMERPEVFQAELSVRLNREVLVEAWSGIMPRVDGKFTHTRSKPDPHDSSLDAWGHAWNAALVMNWPVFDGFATMGRVRQARAALQRSVIELADVEEQVLLDVKQALFDIEDADKFVQSQSDNLERAREGLRLAKAGYEAGVNTEIEMLDARQALSQTQALYYQAVYRHETAKLSLQRAQGLLKNQSLGGVIK